MKIFLAFNEILNFEEKNCRDGGHYDFFFDSKMSEAKGSEAKGSEAKGSELIRSYEAKPSVTNHI